MNRFANRTLRFDRFTLDLTRGRLWAGGREIDLRPKTFEVLRHLAENAGRLVPKQELFVAVWPDVAVTDDSLVQCIRELRDRLGDTDRRLIKTVHRRGYLLDTTLTTPQAHSRQETSLETSGAKEIAPVSLFFARHWKLFSGVAATIALFLALGAIYSPKLVAHAPYAQNDLAVLPESMRTPIVSDSYSEQVARRVAQLAAIKHLPLPRLEFRTPANDVSDQIRRYVGVWVSNRGWLRSRRQMMMIITEVDRSGFAFGYNVLGPPEPRSLTHDAAHAFAIKGHISGSTFSYRGRRVDFVVSLDAKDRMRVRADYRNGLVNEVWLYPVWTEAKADRPVMSKVPVK